MNKNASLLQAPKTIAVVGLSDNPDRPSFGVASYLQKQGFRIIPVNPNLTEILGEKSYASLAEVPKELQIDIVDIFRAPEHVLAIVQEAIDSGRTPLIWMQEGVVAPKAKELAEAHQLKVVMDHCIMKEQRSLRLQRSL
jgi:uncharacterized protein